MDEPEPEVMLTRAASQDMKDKRAFETARYQKWFGWAISKIL
jgi:hypothetical protein